VLQEINALEKAIKATKSKKNLSFIVMFVFGLVVAKVQ
jgi:hypothetical protein